MNVSNYNIKMLYLNDTWSTYFHDPLDDDWRNESYVKLIDIASADDYWTFQKLLGDHINNGMFFIMREHVFPCWDDPANINGGCISIKILKDDMVNFWQKLCSKMLTETLLKPDLRSKWNIVNGISTSPKRHFCIVKIWLGESNYTDLDIFDLPFPYNGEIIYKTNISNISLENIRLTHNTCAQQPMTP